MRLVRVCSDRQDCRRLGLFLHQRCTIHNISHSLTLSLARSLIYARNGQCAVCRNVTVMPAPHRVSTIFRMLLSFSG